MYAIKYDYAIFDWETFQFAKCNWNFVCKWILMKNMYISITNTPNEIEIKQLIIFTKRWVIASKLKNELASDCWWFSSKYIFFIILFCAFIVINDSISSQICTNPFSYEHINLVSNKKSYTLLSKKFTYIEFILFFNLIGIPFRIT